jgi:hypothetical protein
MGDILSSHHYQGTPSKPPKNPGLQSADDLHVEVSPESAAEDTTIIAPNPFSRHHNANQTFLTECSFGIAHDRLVQLITDEHGGEPWWEDMKSLDLRGKQVDSLARLKEFCPKLDELIV